MIKKLGRKKKKEEGWKWKGELIEVVKKFKYLGYTLTCNNDDIAHIKEQVAKSRSIMGKLWGIGERYFRNDWKRRKMLFDAMCKSVLLYGVEIWGYKKYEEIEIVKKKYINSTGKLSQK